MSGHGTRELIRGRHRNRSLTFYGMLVRRLIFLTALLLAASASSAFAQNVFRVQIDTVSVKAGDTATVNVYYTFTSTKAHNLNGFVARFLFDSNLVRIVGYNTSGTASDGMSTTESHRGIAAFGSQELDLRNPILVRLRIVASTTLADTAWIRWDRDWPMFAFEAGVDTVVESDGWLRTQTAVGHTTLSTPRRSVSGVITGPFPDSVRFDVPVMISDISSANVISARLQFVFDQNRLALQGATTASTSESISSVGTTQDTGTIIFQGLNGLKMAGADTLVNLHFYALVGADTACTILSGVTWLPLNADARLGTTDVAFDSICIYGRFQEAFVGASSQEGPARLYPNPARDYVVAAGFDAKTVEVYDALGRCVENQELSHDAWTIPASLAAGTYHVIMRDRNGKTAAGKLLLER